MNQPVFFEERPTENGMRIGIATLNAPQTLNGLSLEMAHKLDERLAAWANDPRIAVVVLQGSGDKAFCAGGDLQGLYRSMRESPKDDPWANRYAREFFEVEYRLDYRVHTYPKPVLCWGNGFVMGGGIGLMMGASHRVVSETAKLAMPEITIGLFPDVGASWLLNHMPGNTGMFLALTGAQLNTSDAFFAGLADFHVRQADWPRLMDALLVQPWAGSAGAVGDEKAPAFAPRSINDGLLRQALHALEPRETLEPGPLKQHSFQVNNLCSGTDLHEIYENIASLADNDDPWLSKAARTMLAGSPGTARLAFTLLHRLRQRSLEDVFRAEYVAALQAAAHGDFAEGIRALLIDKDRKPRWNPATIEQADKEWVLKFFEEPWPSGQAHPLENLGAA